MKLTYLQNKIPVLLHRDQKFGCNRVSIHLSLPRDEQTASTFATVATLMRRGNDTYNTFASFNRKLCDLYGAYYDCHIDAVGDRQVFTFSVQTIDNTFAFEGEDVYLEQTRFLCDMLCCQSFGEQVLSDTDIENEKQNLIEDIQSVLNNKRAYLLKLAEEVLYQGTPMAVSKYGTHQGVAALSRKDIIQGYSDMLAQGQVYVTVIGRGEIEQALPILNERLSHLPTHTHSGYNTPNIAVENTDITKPMAVTQSKLALAFLPTQPLDDDEIDAMRVALTLLSKMPTSRLFMNVREKLSLCYYCDARFNRVTGLFTIDMGLSQDKSDLAVQAIHDQLQDLTKGNISDQELEHMRQFIKNSYVSIMDSQSELDSWFIGQMLQDKCQLPDETLQKLLQVDKARIGAVLGKFTQKLIYKIVPQEDKQHEN